MSFLSDFRWYRKRRGGTWYHVRYEEAAIEGWTQREPPIDHPWTIVIALEIYDRPVVNA